MQVKLSQEVEKKVGEAAHALGLNENEVVNQALLFYLDTISKNLSLKLELQAWENLSDEAWANFESQLWKKGKSG
ncbi:MAG: hypothetical protein HYX24_04515 [Candidatus Aenigmarchaeota archaeon]|nr:hypothetical protein [Candidatus Aenigmarchaeota archaeon]